MWSHVAIRLMMPLLWIFLSAGDGRAGVASDHETGFRFVEDAEAGCHTITEDGKPVLTYHFKKVPVPAGVSGPYAVARAGYIHPLYGPDGEVLTKDYSPDHPHHRGLYWAWPEVTWKGETRDLHALQGVFTRPVRVVRKEVRDDRAVLEVESLWMWGDTEPIVREFATITAFGIRDGCRMLDFEFRFQALVDGVTLARRGKSHYGGFNIRLSARGGQTILKHTDPDGQPERKAWASLSGLPPGGQQGVSLVILQNRDNPDYPGDWIDYPELNWLQPTFPAKETAYALKTDAPLVLRYRVVVHRGAADDATEEKLWTEYNERGVQPPAGTLPAPEERMDIDASP